MASTVRSWLRQRLKELRVPPALSRGTEFACDVARRS